MFLALVKSSLIRVFLLGSDPSSLCQESREKLLESWSVSCSGVPLLIDIAFGVLDLELEIFALDSSLIIVVDSAVLSIHFTVDPLYC